MDNNYTEQISNFGPKSGDVGLLNSYLRNTVDFINGLDEFRQRHFLNVVKITALQVLRDDQPPSVIVNRTIRELVLATYYIYQKQGVVDDEKLNDAITKIATGLVVGKDYFIFMKNLIVEYLASK